jgi:AraC-like DNA-binding protein
LRANLAGFAAHEAAQRVAEGHSPATLKNRLLEMQQEAQRGRYAAFFEADMGFHRAIAQLADSPPLEEMWILLENRFREFAAWSHQALFRDLQIIADAHIPQFETIAAGNAKAAQQVAQVDLDAVWQMLVEQPVEASGEADVVERVCSYVILHLHRALSLELVAREVAHLSSGHLARLFQERRKESFTAYVRGLRMRRAANLLRETDLAVGQVASRVGYPDVSHFAAHFGRHYGVSPSAYKRR